MRILITHKANAHFSKMFGLCDILNYIYPKRCVFCDDLLYGNGDVCAECWKKVFWISQRQACEKCGMPLQYKLESFCDECKRISPIFDRAVSVLLYNNHTKRPILLFKNGDATYLAKTFAQWIYRNIKPHIDSYDMIIPVPIHRKKLRKRMYNQAGLIALELSKLASIRYEPFILEKSVNTRPQEGLGRAMRLQNLLNSFSLKGNVSGKSIILVDDVITTGATINECSKLLKQNGAHRILVASLARVKY